MDLHWFFRGRLTAQLPSALLPTPALKNASRPKVCLQGRLLTGLPATARPPFWPNGGFRCAGRYAYIMDVGPADQHSRRSY